MIVTVLAGSGGGGGGATLRGGIDGETVTGAGLGAWGDSSFEVSTIATPPTASSTSATAIPKTNCGKRCHDRCSSTSSSSAGGTYCATARVVAGSYA